VATDDRHPIAELLGRLREAVSQHLFDVIKAMVASPDRSGTRGLAKEDFRRLCERYITLTPQQVTREEEEEK